jgi:hypothetical protein
MFEITGDDIALLSDEDLRSLVGMLCESEVKQTGFSTSGVTWGGNQNAADGGLDVRVSLPDGAEISGFVPRAATGFQVKRSDMPRAEILEEMRPGGTLRPVFRELANRSGAYIIVSAAGSTSDVALRNRRDAMKEALEDLPEAQALTVDFYDRGRLATWVRDHPGLIPWIREKIGRSIAGWRGYGPWAYDPDGTKSEYLVDGQLRVLASCAAKDGEVPVSEAIRLIRDRLNRPRSLVRLAGLSGVGKTRLAQALFDGRVSGNNLDSASVCYANVGDGPDPSPTIVARDLVASRARAILIIDNCPPHLHRELSEVCRSPESQLSLLTVEYDIREDEPEETDVFLLQASSTDLIEKLVSHRFPSLSAVDVRTVAEFSGGNARIAIALAGTIGKDETIKGLRDEDLFRRLFEQRNEPSELLLDAAQALSLVYSFEGEDVSAGPEAELIRLGTLIGRSPAEMFAQAAELERRGLVQRRGPWRAVLPQAIANRLAATALENIPYDELEKHLVNGAPERLLKSFSRRLSYLSSSKEAQAIGRRWLKPGGFLEDVAQLNNLGQAILNNVAPVVPEDALSALERALVATKSPETMEACRHYLHLLRSLAYDPALFDRCIGLIVKLAVTGGKESDEASKVFASLFPIYASGTHATVDQRLAAIRPLLRSEDAKARTLGLQGLRGLLEAAHFGPGYNFEFGARSRDYGYWPRTVDEVKRWFGEALKFAETIACSNAPATGDVREVVAEKFRGLWSSAAMYDDLERVCRSICAKRFWTDGWLAVRQTLFYDFKGFSPEVLTRLTALEELLRPKDLVEKVRSIVLPESVIYVGLDGTHDGANDVSKTLAEVEGVAQELGRAVAADPDALEALAPELIAASSQQSWSFGRGLAEAAEDARAIWERLSAQFQATPPGRTNFQVFRGFLHSLYATKRELYQALLDEAVNDATLGQWYPVLQTSVAIDPPGVERLMRALEIGKAWIGTYRTLVGGGVAHQIPGADFNRLLSRIAQEPEGFNVAVEIFCMRLSFEEGRKQSSEFEIVELGCELMRRINFSEKAANDTYRLGIVTRFCLVGEKGAATVREICRKLKEAVSKREVYAFHYGDLLRLLLNAQPAAALDALCGGDAADVDLGLKILEDASQFTSKPLDALSANDLLAWCEEKPGIRCPVVAAGITAFRISAEDGRHQLTATAQRLLELAPDRVAVLRKYLEQFGPMEWTTSYRAVVESSAKLLDQFSDYPDPRIREFVANEKERLANVVIVEPQVETQARKLQDERFE